MEPAKNGRSRWLGPDRVIGVAVGAVLAAAYAATLCPTVHWYDSAEFSASATTLRVVPHPPGYPLYAIIAHCFTLLPVEPAFAVNIMSAVFGVACGVLVYAIALRFDVDRISAAVAGVTFGVMPSLWENAVKAEVYTPGTAWMLGVLLCCVIARERDRLWIAWLAAWLGGVGLGVHMGLATFGLGFTVLLLPIARPRDGPVRKFAPRRFAALALGCIVAALVGSLVFLLIPLGPFEEVTPLGPWGTSSERMWNSTIDGVQGGVFRNYYRSFPPSRFLTLLGIFRSNLTIVGLALAGVGTYALVRRRRVVAIALWAGVVGNVAWFFNYDVPDIDVFLLPSTAALVLLMATGLDAGRRLLRERMTRADYAPALALPIPIALAIWTGPTVDLSDDDSARIYGEQACADLPENAVLAMTSMPKEWRRYTVVLYMHEAGLGCEGVEFWGMARGRRLALALGSGRPVYTFVDRPRFANTFEITKEGVLYRVRRNY